MVMRNKADTNSLWKNRPVLIVEKQTEIRELLRLTLEGGGFGPVITLSDGDSALETALRQHPVLVLTGIGLGDGMDGIALTRSLKSRNTWKQSICIVSAQAQQADIAEGLAAGADAYWVKPFSPGKLLLRVRALLRGPQKNGE